MARGFAMVENARRRFTCENASKRVPFCRSRCCFAHAMDAKIVQNRRKLTTKIITKKQTTTPGLAMVRNARRRTTCKNASKRVHFCCSRCCFAHAMDAKFAQNRRKSSMGTCNLSTVGPAARRANSKCIALHRKISTVPAPRFCPHFARRRTHLHSGKRHF